MEYQSIRNPLRRDQTKNDHSGYGSINDLPTSRKPHSTSMRSNASVDEFGDLELTNEKSIVNKIMRTGRQRKKIASRSKGGEFQQRRKKRRVYFCCVSNEIDIEQFHDNFDKQDDQKWKSRMYEGVLHLYYSPAQMHNLSVDMPIDKVEERSSPMESDDYFQCSPDGYEAPIETYNSTAGYSDYLCRTGSGSLPIINEELEIVNEVNNNVDYMEVSKELINEPSSLILRQRSDNPENENAQTASMLVLTGGKEVFVFDFGAVVFWGFKHGEEEEILDQIRYHVVKDW
jgi:uncharacterized Rmd1/YagE family protein